VECAGNAGCGEVFESVRKCNDSNVYEKLRQLEGQLAGELEQTRRAQALCARLQRELIEAGRVLASGTWDFRKAAVLYVDADTKSLGCFSREYAKVFRVLTANNATEGLKVASEPRNQVGIVIADQRMPQHDGRWLLEKVRQTQPRLVRILVSTFPTKSELLAASSAANSGAIYGFIVKPWEPLQLEPMLKRALEYFLLAVMTSKVADALRASRESSRQDSAQRD
jgi:response regulator RpfG family c-di-GMP phosphodiesterase